MIRLGETDIFAVMGWWRQYVIHHLITNTFGLSSKIVVVGCGDMVLPNQSNVVGIDINFDARSITLQSDAQLLPIKTGSVDLVVATELIEHIPKPHLFLDEVFRVLKPHGLFLLSFPNAAHLLSRLALLAGAFIEDRTMHEDSINHVHFFDTKFVVAELSKKFDVIHCYNRYIVTPLWIIRSRKICSMFPNLCYQAMYLFAKRE
jgi:SAM-dependent methyltransferase